MKIFYLRSASGFPVGCVATSLQEGTISFGVSSYNPSDKFSKAEARKQATNRLETDPKMVAKAPIRGETKKAILNRIIELNREGYKPVSHTVAQAAKLQLAWDETCEFWNQWKFKYEKEDRINGHC